MPGKRHSRHHGEQLHATVLVDYSNLFGCIAETSLSDADPDHIALEVVKELQRHVTEHLQLHAVRTVAFANVSPGSTRGHRVTGTWLAAGIEPRFSYASIADESSAVDLAMEAVEVALGATRRHAFIILSGNHWFVPLVQRLQRKGHFVFLAALEAPSHADHLPVDVSDAFLNARFLLDRVAPSGDHHAGDGHDPDQADALVQTGGPEAVLPIEDDAIRRALEVIEQYFGQYEEIYLTPLLRKLSEVLSEEEEPKDLITGLEETGVVWLEKRRGFPHNYTVLLVNEDHPDVIDVREEAASDDDADTYDELLFDEDGADEYFEDPTNV